MATEFEIQIDDGKVKSALKRLAGRTSNLRPVMSVIGETVKSSVIRNFELGGRWSGRGSLPPPPGRVGGAVALAVRQHPARA
jgi:phage gpG-like protein